MGAAAAVVGAVAAVVVVGAVAAVVAPVTGSQPPPDASGEV